MLNELRRKAPNENIQAVVGEAARLPFPTANFDAVILARALYLMADWQTVLSQACDALRPGGCLFHEWGNGQADEEWVQIRERARRFHPGARSEAHVHEFLLRLGLHHRNELRTGPGPIMTLGDFVEKIVSGEFSYIWNVPKHLQGSCLPGLKGWAENTFDLDESIPIPRELRWTTYRKQYK